MHDGVPLWPPLTFPQQLPIEHSGYLELQLLNAGYSVKIDGKLDPVTKSALADYLRPDASRPLDPSVTKALEGTVLTGRRDPAAWNARFGLNRLASIVERPLTGPGGQLDEHGNVVER